MPVNCADFVKKVQTKKALFGLLGKGTQWKFYIDSEIAPLLKSDKVKEDMQMVTGKAEWKNNKLNVLVDGDKLEARKAIKAAYTAEKMTWEDAKVDIKGGTDDKEPTPGQGNVAQGAGIPAGQNPNGAAVARPLDSLQLHKIKVLNPNGPQGGIFNVPMALTDLQINGLLANLPPGTQAKRVNAGAITLDTPVPTATSSTAMSTSASAPAPQQAPVRPQQQAPVTNQQPSPKPATADSREYLKFKTRIVNLMPEIKLLPPGNEALAKKATEAMNLAKTEPAQATRQLDELTKELARLAGDDRWLRLAAQFRMDWERASGGSSVKDKALLDSRKAFEALLSSKQDYKAAVAALLKLQKALEAKHEVRKQVMHNWNPTKNQDKQVATIATNLKLPEGQVKGLVDASLQEMREESAGIRPEGFKLDEVTETFGMSIANPSIPAGGRPTLNLEEAQAVQLYSKGSGANPNDPNEKGKAWAPYVLMNKALWKGEEPAPPHDKDYKQLQAAFAKTKPFPKPVKVSRGVRFDNKEDLDKFLKPYKDNVGTKTLVPMTGFISSCSAGVPAFFDGNVKLNIVAKQGLDLAPYSDSPWEAELLLNHNTMVKVLKIKKKGEVHEVFVEQILVKATSAGK